MSKNSKHFAKLERYITYALLLSFVLFIIFLIAAGNGIIWLKVIIAILTIPLCGLCLYALYLSKLLLHQRSLWMTVGAVSIILCILFSLILNFPSPAPTLDSVKAALGI